MSQKPILFLDFDRTLFDTERYYLWLGEPRRERNQALIDGILELPDFSQFLFSDTIDFLSDVHQTHDVIILSFVKLEYSPQQPTLQLKKIRGAGVLPYVDDIVVTIGNKGEEAARYLREHKREGESFVFIDDEPAHLKEMRTVNTKAVCIYLDRKAVSTGIPVARGMDVFTSEHVAHGLVEAKLMLTR